jgi:hypothetical protein
MALKSEYLTLEEMAVPASPADGDLWFDSTRKTLNLQVGGVQKTLPAPDSIVTVAKQGGDYTSVAAAVASITDASSAKPYVVKVEPGVYTESPFAMKQWVSVVGAVPAYGVELVTDDNDAHFITGNQNCTLSNVTITGPTGTGFAGIHLNTGSVVVPFVLDSVYIKTGYYGVFVEGAYSLSALRVSNLYSGTPIQNLFRVTAGGFLVALLSGFRSGTADTCAVAFYCEGAASTMNFNTCFSRGATKGIYLDDGCTCRVSGTSIDTATTAMEIGTLGTGTHLEATACSLRQSATNHIVIGSSTGEVIFHGVAEVSKTTVASGAILTGSLLDEGDNAVTVLGEMKLGDEQGNLIALSKYAKEVFCTGHASGGAITPGAGNTVDVAAGTGYINDGAQVSNLSWNAAASVALTANAFNFIYVNMSGSVLASVTEPDLELNIVLGSVRAGASAPVAIAIHFVELSQHLFTAYAYSKDVIGPVLASGCATSENATALRIDLDAGSYYVYNNLVSASGAAPVTFVYWYRDGVGGWTTVISQTVIDDQNYDDGSGTLAAITAGKYKKDVSYITVGGNGPTFHVVYGQELFDAQDLAENGNNPTVPPFLSETGLRSGGITVLQNAGVIASVVDARPIATATASSGGAASDHGLLTGLLDDDHTQYLLANGSRAMSGSLDMGANAITNVGNIDGVDVSSHNARHLQSGLDEIDGDKLDIDWNPTNYTPTSAPAEADNVDHLTAHLAGIDSKLGATAAGNDISVSFATDSSGYVSRNLAASYEIAATVYFRGTTVLGTPASIAVIKNAASASPAHSIRIYNVTNAQIIAELTGRTATGLVILNMGTLSNLPTGQAVFEIQVKRDAAGSVNFALHGVVIRF